MAWVLTVLLLILTTQRSTYLLSMHSNYIAVQYVHRRCADVATATSNNNGKYMINSKILQQKLYILFSANLRIDYCDERLDN